MREDSGNIGVVASVLRNSLARTAVVTFSTLDNTARVVFGISDAYPAWIDIHSLSHFLYFFSHIELGSTTLLCLEP